MTFFQGSDEAVNFVVAQLRGEPLPIQQALEACSRTIAMLEQRIAIAQELLADQVVIQGLLTAALAEQQQPQK